MGRERRASFGIEFEGEPQRFPAFEVVGDTEIAGAFVEAALALTLNLDAKHASALGTDFVLVRDAGRAERHGEWTELYVAATVLFGVVAAEEQAKERKFM